MNKKIKRHYSTTLPIANKIMERLQPACERIEIAGSLRRKSKLVGDIEFICFPKVYKDLFGGPLGETEVDKLIESWPVELIMNGGKYKKFFVTTRHQEIYQVDLFIQPDPQTWGVNMMIRTGPDTFSKKMVTPRSKGGFMPSMYAVAGARVWYERYLKTGKAYPLDTSEEEKLFELWEMDFIHPKDRR